MKKLICLLFVAMLAVTMCACASKKTEPKEESSAEESMEEVSTEEESFEPKGSGDEFLGIWECDRASIEITAKGDEYHCLIHWGSSATEATTWEYDCYFDGRNIVSNEVGVKTNMTWDENEVETDEVVYTDGAMSLSLSDDRKLTWTDYKEDAGKDMEFTYVGPVE